MFGLMILLRRSMVERGVGAVCSLLLSYFAHAGGLVDLSVNSQHLAGVRLHWKL